jgi:hypothetical protein
MANSYSMSRRNFKRTIKIVSPPSGSDSTQQLNSVIFVWGKIHAPRFLTFSGEEFDPRSWKNSRSTHAELGWKAECDLNKRCQAAKPHEQTLASQDQQTQLPRKRSSWPALGCCVQCAKFEFSNLFNS